MLIRIFKRACLVIGVIVLLGRCSEEKTMPVPIEPPPPVDTLYISPVMEVIGYSGMKNRVGHGDYLCDSLFIIENLPSGQWQYSLQLGEVVQSGEFEYLEGTIKLPNNFPLKEWMKLSGNDSITISLELYSDDYIMADYQEPFVFVHEPYKIRSWQDLQAMEYDKTGSYTLQNDIEFPEPTTEGFPEQGFIPVGTSGPSDAPLLNAFMGSLEGNNYQIKNFCIDRSDLNYVGLFGVLSDASVKNLVIHVSEKGIHGGSYVGVIAGYVAQQSVIENCKLIGNINGLNQVGGIAGALERNSQVRLSRTTGVIQGINNVGGIVGWSMPGSTVHSGFVEGEVMGSQNTGGIVGYHQGVLERSQSGGEINTITVEGIINTGGLVGYNSGEIDGSRTIKGGIRGEDAVGGLIGYAEVQSLCSESCAKSEVEGSSQVGGLIGKSLGEISNCYALGIVEGEEYSGGLIGYFDGQIVNSYVAVQVNGSNSLSTGAFVGYSLGTVTGSYFDEEKAFVATASGNGAIIGVEGKNSESFTQYTGQGETIEMFAGWNFQLIWENEVPLKDNELYPGLKKEFNFE